MNWNTQICNVKQKKNTLKTIEMKKQLLNLAGLVLLVQTFGSCNFSRNTAQAEYKKNHLLTKADQDALTPDQVLQQFKDGNERFITSNFTKRAHSEEIRKAVTGGQFPKAMVLSCVDSRVPVEDVFDQGLGDVFVGRVAGNFVNTDLLGSMEFACKVSGAKLILVMAHQHCGAVKGAIDDVHLGNITSMLANLRPAVEMSQSFAGEKTSKNESYVRLVAQNNVRNTIAQIRSKSEILRTMESQGAIKIVGAFYTLRTGELQFLD